jgi:hypothetical protein
MFLLGSTILSKEKRIADRQGINYITKQKVKLHQPY